MMEASKIVQDGPWVTTERYWYSIYKPLIIRWSDFVADLGRKWCQAAKVDAEPPKSAKIPAIGGTFAADGRPKKP